MIDGERPEAADASAADAPAVDPPAAGAPPPAGAPPAAESRDDADEPRDTAELERLLEALLFLSSDPVTAAALAEAIDAEPEDVAAGLTALGAHYDEQRRGIVLRELAGGWVLASSPHAEDAARRLFGKPRTPPLTPAQAETLAVVAYLQPVSRPEIARIRGVNAESAAATLIERGVIEEAGRSQFGAVLYRTTELFLRLFGLRSLRELPDVTAWDPSPEVAATIRDRLLRAGEARLAVPSAAQPAEGRVAARSDEEEDGEDRGRDEDEDDGPPAAPVIPISPRPAA